MSEYYKNKSLGDLREVVDNIIKYEEWREIQNSEGFYWVSNFGRVKSLARTYTHPYRGVVQVEEKILSQQISTYGYCIVQVIVNGRKTKYRVHRLVGFAFIPNPENKPQINHKKGVRHDNRAWMLEWNTNSENNLHAYRELGRKRPQSHLGRIGSLHHASKRVYCATLQLYFESARQAAKQLGLSQGSISHACNGRQLHVDGFVFNYAI